MESIVDTLRNIDIMGKAKAIKLRNIFYLRNANGRSKNRRVYLLFTISNYNGVGISNFPSPYTCQLHYPEFGHSNVFQTTHWCATVPCAGIVIGSRIYITKTAR